MNQVLSRGITREELMDRALDAAIEIERAINNESVNVNSISKFVDALNSTLVKNPSPGSGYFYPDSRMISIFGRAASTLASGEIKTVDQVVQWVSDNSSSYKDRLAGPAERDDGQPLRLLRDFCIAIHRHLKSDLVGELRATGRYGRNRHDVRVHSSAY